MRIRILDKWKWIAAILVVAIHTSPLESINELADFILTREFARIAVPLFFMITGYFGLNQDSILPNLKKLAYLYLGVTVLYLPVLIYKYVPIQGMDVGKIITGILKAVFFDGTYYHLWYIPAVMEGLVLVYLLLKLGKEYAFGISVSCMESVFWGTVIMVFFKITPFCKTIMIKSFRFFHKPEMVYFLPLYLSS